MPKTILVVDDDPMIREVMVDFLGDRGYHTIDAGSGIDGLQILQTQTVHLLISDVIMPDMSGTEMALKAVCLYPDLPVILMSGSFADPPDERWPFLAKPFRLNDLLVMVVQIVPEVTPMVC